MLLAQAGEPGARRSRHLRRLGGGLGGDVGDLCGDLLGGAGGLDQNAGGVVDGKLCEVVGIEADLDDGAMPDAGDRILIAVQLDPTAARRSVPAAWHVAPHRGPAPRWAADGRTADCVVRVFDSGAGSRG